MFIFCLNWSERAPTSVAVLVEIWVIVILDVEAFSHTLHICLWRKFVFDSFAFIYACFVWRFGTRESPCCDSSQCNQSSHHDTAITRVHLILGIR